MRIIFPVTVSEDTWPVRQWEVLGIVGWIFTQSLTPDSTVNEASGEGDRLWLVVIHLKGSVLCFLYFLIQDPDLLSKFHNFNKELVNDESELVTGYCCSWLTFIYSKLFRCSTVQVLLTLGTWPMHSIIRLRLIIWRYARNNSSKSRGGMRSIGVDKKDNTNKSHHPKEWPVSHPLLWSQDLWA